MRLLNTRTLRFGRARDLAINLKAGYAILSHRWDDDPDKEVLYGDIISRKAEDKPWYDKVDRVAKIALGDGFDWIWIDTCCIDRDSSAEVTEAINSMYRWYNEAGLCYVYLKDVGQTQGLGPLHESEWFERGWTLQELIAPREVRFFDSNWGCIADKRESRTTISNITKIHPDALQDKRDLRQFSVAQKLSWVANRKTKCPEDIAYCLLGIFGVNMVHIYGEGERNAFIRLQEEIIKHDDDHSVFAWSMKPLQSKVSGLLAPDPCCFQYCAAANQQYSISSREPFSVTNRGLSIELEITPWAADVYLAFIESSKCQRNQNLRLGIFLRRLRENDQYARVQFHSEDGLFVDEDEIYDHCRNERTTRPIRRVRAFVRHSPDPKGIVGGPDGQEVIFKLPKWWFQNAGPDDDIETLRTLCLDDPWHLKIKDLPSHAKFKQVALGFDFDFNPVCLLTDPMARTDALLIPPIIVVDDKVKDAKFLAEEKAKVYLNYGSPGKSNNATDHIWRLKGHRIYGMCVVLLKSLNGLGPRVILERGGIHSPIWELTVIDRNDAVRYCSSPTDVSVGVTVAREEEDDMPPRASSEAGLIRKATAAQHERLERRATLPIVNAGAYLGAAKQAVSHASSTIWNLFPPRE